MLLFCQTYGKIEKSIKLIVIRITQNCKFLIVSNIIKKLMSMKSMKRSFK